MKIQEQQIISRERVAVYGEVMTSRHEVEAMLDLVRPETERIEGRFLDPACGTGNFLTSILKRKLARLKNTADLLPALSSIYGIDIQRDNVETARERMLKLFLESFQSSTGQNPLPELTAAARCILAKNILHGDAIHTQDQVTVPGVPGSDQIIFTEWHRSGNDFEQREFRFGSKEMKFDVIIGNPPYQLSVGNEGGNRSKAKSIYHLFMQSAMDLMPSHLVMITPSRWMTKTAEGIPKDWVDRQLASGHFRIIHDFENPAECFPGVSIMGGVNYFLWEKDYSGPCRYIYHKDGRTFERLSPLDKLNCGIVVRDPVACGIIEKISKSEPEYYNDPERNFSRLVGAKDFYTTKTALTSSWDRFETEPSARCRIKYYCNPAIHKVPFGWIREDQIPKNRQTAGLHKVLIAAANSSSFLVLGKPFYAGPGSVCSQTYLVIGGDPDHPLTGKKECENIISYIRTRFFRYLVSIRKRTQNGPRGVYQFVPLQDFTKPWTDEELFRKYGFTAEEIRIVKSRIRPLE
jgi:site-specific DNA-methyltransferase (adenine-specific)